MMQGLLKLEGFEIGRNYTATLIKKMGIEAAGPTARSLILAIRCIPMCCGK